MTTCCRTTQISYNTHLILSISDNNKCSTTTFRGLQMVTESVVKKYFWSCDSPTAVLLSAQLSWDIPEQIQNQVLSIIFWGECVMTSFLHRITSLKWIGSIFMQSICILEAFVNIWWLALAPGGGTDRQGMLVQCFRHQLLYNESKISRVLILLFIWSNLGFRNNTNSCVSSNPRDFGW